jgi:Na+/proline symporter
VQRYLTARSVDEGRSSLLMSAYWKIPLQVLVLVVGILTFVYYVFHTPPMLFNPVHDRAVRASAAAPEYAALEQEFAAAVATRRASAEAVASARRGGDAAALARARETFRADDAAVRAVKQRGTALVRQATGDTRYADVNYVFPTFIMTALPIGLVGLWIVAIITAATDTIAAELNSLATATVIDFYKRHVDPEATERRVLRISKIATAGWGLFACGVAVYASTLGSLIEVVNRFGSFFYGSILGVFLLALLTRRATGTGAFVGLIAGMSAVAAVATFRPDISFLWHNVVGATVVFVVGFALSLVTGQRTPNAPQRDTDAR